MLKRLVNNVYIRISLVFMFLLSTFMIASPLINAVDNLPNSVKVVEGNQTPNYDDVNVLMFKLANGNYAYCLDASKASPVGFTAYLDQELNAGYAYIMANGFPKKKITGDNQQDYYITQTAIWYFVDLTTGTNSLKESFKNSNSLVAVKARKLANEALNAKAKGYKNPVMNVTSTMNIAGKEKGDKYISSPVKVSGDFENYSVTLVNAPASARVVDVNGNAKNTFTKNEEYYVEVDKKEMQTGAKIKTKVSADASITKAYRYKTEDNDVQRIMPIVSSTVLVKLWTEVNFDLNLGTLEIKKVDDETREGLKGAKLELEGPNGEKIATWISDGKYKKFDNLIPGVYKIKEIEAPNGYKKLLNAITVNVIGKSVEKVLVTNFKNDRGSIIIVKRDAKTGEVISGAKLKLLGPDGNEILTWTTTNEAKKISNLKFGEYQVVEVEAPTGYQLSNKKYKVNINEAKEYMVNFLNDKINNEKETKLIIYKRDSSTNNILSGAEMTLTNEAGNVIAKWITTDEAKVFNKINPGTYYLKEVKAPNGYIKSNLIEKIEVVKESEVVVNFYNDKEVLKGKVLIGKYDAETNSYLAGAHIIVRNEKGEVVADYISSNNLKVIDNLIPGFYTVEEVEAPNGYARYLDKLDFSVNNGSLTHEIKLYNTKEIEVPITEASMNIIPVMLGALMFIFGAIGIYKEKQNEA